MNYSKYHALGNDYLVITPEDLKQKLNGVIIRLLCHRNYGIGSDGILLGPLASKTSDFRLKIFNPDGSEAEKSGNGLRIFARSLWDNKLVGTKPFTVETAGGEVSCLVSSSGRQVTVEMGKVVFKEIQKTIKVKGKILTYCAVSIGNPHCVIFSNSPTPRQTKRYGPLIETDPRFPNRTNVQFMTVIDRNTIRIEIWERGAGYTLASGSSSSAAAAVAYKLGFCERNIIVQMPGGSIQIQLDEEMRATMKGPVTKVCDGIIADEMFTAR